MPWRSTYLYPFDPAYPADDGEPMGEGTLQIEWIQALGSGFLMLYGQRPDFLVASNLLWYPIEGDNSTRIAPHVMIAVGRPNAERYSYLQWKEDGQPPQFVLDVHPPTHPSPAMLKRYQFYRQFGVQEYVAFDPHVENSLHVWRRRDGELVPVEAVDGWTSSLLGARFHVEQCRLVVTPADGRRFVSFWDAVLEQVEQAEAMRTAMRIDRMAARLRELGVDPDSL